MLKKRVLALLLSVLMVWPSIGIAVAQEDFAPASPPQGMYRVLQPICERRQIAYHEGYRTGKGVTYAPQVRETPVEHLALYMNVYIDNAEGDDLDLLQKARYRQIDIQRYMDGTYYEVRWGFNDIALQPGWNRLLLRFDTDKNADFTPADDRMQVVAANKQTINWDETASFNFCLSMVEDGACSQYTIIVDDVAIVDTSRPVNEAMPQNPDYFLLQDISSALPDQDIPYAGGYRTDSLTFTASDQTRHTGLNTTALFMNVYIDNQNLPYHTGLLRDTALTRRLTLSDDEERSIVWENASFDQLQLQPGWNTVVWRLSDDAGLWDGIAADTTSAELSFDGTLQIALEISGMDATYDRYRIQIARAALVDVSRRANGEAYYDTTYDVLRFSAAEKTYAAAGQALSTGWILADGMTEQTGADVHQHNPSGLRLTMTLTLHTEEETADNGWFREGTIHLRSVDDNAGGVSGGYWRTRSLRLKQGDNRLSLRLDELIAEDGGAALDYTAMNRMAVELTGTAAYLGKVEMTLANVKVVDIAGRREGEAAVAVLSDGMLKEDAAIYNLNAAEWGADPTGQEDCTAAIQECLDTLRTNGGVVFLPAGRYRIMGTLNIPAGVTLRGEWQNPNNGGAGKGTILMAYAGAGDESTTPFISLKGASCLRDISVWYPEQNPVQPRPYPATIAGDGHTVVKNVTLYNSYIGFYNGSCSSMLIRGFYATVLKQGIYGANAYDIPRIEQVSVDTRYWINSGLPGAPAGLQADQLNSYTRQQTVGLIGGRQDWGYWYDIEINNAKIGIQLFAGNDAVGKLTTRNVQYGIYTTNVNAPGLQITHSDIAASVECVHYQVDGLQTLVATKTIFRDAPIGIHTVNKTNHGVSLNDCTFINWEQHALYMEGGHLTAANNTFVDDRHAIWLDKDVPQALLAGNTFAAPAQAVTAADTTWLQRDDAQTDIPHAPEYAFVSPQTPTPAADGLFLVTDYGARAGGVRDCTSAFQEALDAAEAAGGGTVYVPGGTYRLDGSLTVPAGVELRGSFDGAHYGNSTFNGTQLYVYGGKNEPDGAPFITLGKHAGARGFTVFYPEQTIRDPAVTDGPQVDPYPYTIRMDEGCWVETVSFINAYNGIDAMTNRCDGLLVRDTTGCVLQDTIQVGHGMVGGTIHNLHLNPSGWSSRYGNRPGKWLDSYANAHSNYLILGDCTNLNIFSSFNIIINTQMHLIQDPYTGGCFNGTTWGIAFDASQHGIVCDGGIDSNLIMLATMGVFNQNGGSYNVITKPGFTGEVTLFNADAWGGNSKIACVEGGRVNIVQYLSMSAYEGVCRAGGELNFYSGVWTSRSGDNGGYMPDLTYEAGSRGGVYASLDCAQTLNVNIEPGAQVTEALNGRELQPAIAVMTFREIDGPWQADTDWIVWDGKAASFNLNGRNKHNLRLWVTIETPQAASATLRLRSAGDDEQTSGWTVDLQPGLQTLSLPMETLVDGDSALDASKTAALRIEIEGVAFTVRGAQITDLTALYQQKQRLYTAYLAQPANTTNCRASDVHAYETACEQAQGVYGDERADEVAIREAAEHIQMAIERLVPVDKTVLRATIKQAETLDGTLYTPETVLAVSQARETAQMVLADTDATQAAVDEAVQDLQQALDELVQRPTRLKGDVDGDGRVTPTDALMTLQAATQKISLTEDGAWAADIAGDGIDTTDALMILQYATGKLLAW